MRSPKAILLFVLALAAPIDGSLHAQGSLEPPQGTPAASMKSLQEIWDEIAVLKAQIGGLEGQLTDLRSFLGAPSIIRMAPVKNAGNSADTVIPNSGRGSVGYDYSIGTYEVTNAQYAQFLNAVAAADPNALFNIAMGTDPRGGITRSGTSRNYTYAVKGYMGEKPVNFVSWYDALRFCNWLHNGRPTGAQDNTTTEGGAYTLTGPTTITLPGSDPNHGSNGRNTGARFWIPSENEWYKAAYHDPVNAGADAGGTADYWLYPTQSDAAPTLASADLDGNINNDVANLANHERAAEWNGQVGNVTTVGSGGPGSTSYYGAFDMAGNVWEWNEQNFDGTRGQRGGSWSSFSFGLVSSALNFDFPTNEASLVGFRIAGP